ncbi:MAG: hypothetical protein MJY74_04925 [Bacteroidaceae bacterium]|nr:hypothetical protein [Bacteroidaceae bacterium]
MAKLQTKSNNINPFGGLFPIFKTLDKSGVRNVIDRTLDPRGTLLAFSHGDIFASLLGCNLLRFAVLALCSLMQRVWSNPNVKEYG